MNKDNKEIFVNKYESNKLKDIFSSNIFWAGLFVKLILAFTLASDVLVDLFIPFIDYYVQSGFQSPYEHFIKINQSNSFPYPALMLYIVSIPRVIFGFIADWSSISPIVIFLARLPVLLADFLILTLLSHLIKRKIRKILIYYWISPILVYINYIHGQFDAIPISILFISLYFLFKRKFEYSSVFLGLAIAAKTNMVIVLPFYFTYLLHSRTVNTSRLCLNILITISSLLFINISYLFDSAFIEMVFNNKEQIRIFDSSYDFANGNVLYLAPFSYLFLLIIAINLKGFSKDVYMMFLGFSFGIIALMVSPMQGWYYWIIPFFIYFHSKRPNTKLDFTLVLFLGLQLAYFIYFLLIKDSDYLEVLQIITPNFAMIPNTYSVLQSLDINANIISDLSFTLLQAVLLANCVFIYKSGIRSYANYKMFSRPFLLGICGDSGSGKTTISDSIKSIFKRDTTIIRGDDMHKWERGDENWSNFTHLNPKSNLLHSEISYLKTIKNSGEITRRNYDHNTGTFTEEKKFKPRNLVIFEGLHSFYIKQMRSLYDLKIFVNPSEKLRKLWKVNRDIKKRGYSRNKILAQLENRQEDSEKFIKTQLKYADIIIELIANRELPYDGDCDHNLFLRITSVNSIYLEPLFNELSKIKSIKSKHDYGNEDRQFIEINGSISSQEIDDIAYSVSLISELEDLGIYNPYWDKNYLGIIQLFISYCIMKSLGVEEQNS